VPPSAAFAATATLAGEGGVTVDYRAAAGEANAVTASASGSTVTIADSRATVTSGSGCTTVDPHTVQCSASSVPAELAAELGDGDDTLAVSGTLDTFADGGAGNDRLTSAAGDDALIGGSGADSLTGGAGSDALTGDGFAATSPGDDTVDTADYSGRTTAVVVRLDGLAHDGGIEDASGDSVDTEHVTAGAGDDVLLGDDAANRLRAGAGRDHLDGAGGDDTLAGGPGVDVLLGGDGDDTLDANDGEADTVRCEAGEADTALADGADILTGCERVAPAVLTAPTVDGAPTAGQPVTATPSSWMGTPAPSFAYRWLRCAAADGTCMDITGATSGAYTPVRRDTGFRLRIHVVATNPFGTAEATSEPSAPVACRPRSRRADDTCDRHRW
jgi:Ca2+-binding RTX toxin-like protein